MGNKNKQNEFFINNGDGTFSEQAEVYGLADSGFSTHAAFFDYDKDGDLDLIMAGNNFEFKPQFSRLDADYGDVLLNDGNFEFTWQNYDKSGIFIKSEVKHIKQFKDKNGKAFFLFAINDEKPKIFSINE